MDGYNQINERASQLEREKILLSKASDKLKRASIALLRNKQALS
jgi:hypothetical protein